MTNTQNECQKSPFRAFLEMTGQACSEYNIDEMALAGKIYEQHVPPADQQRLEAQILRIAPTIFRTLETIKSGGMPKYAEAKSLRGIVSQTLLQLEQGRAQSPITTLINELYLFIPIQ